MKKIQTSKSFVQNPVSWQAKQNLLTLQTPEALALRKACSLNLMSCYLKTGEFRKTIAEGDEVFCFFNGILGNNC